MSVTFKREPLVSKPGGATGCGIVTTWKLRWPEYFQNFFPLRPSRTIAASLFPALANFRARRPHLRRWRKNSNCAKAFQLARTLAVTERTDTFPRRDAVQGLWWLLLTPAGSRKPNLFVSPRNFAVAGKRNCDGKKLGRNRSIRLWRTGDLHARFQRFVREYVESRKQKWLVVRASQMQIDSQIRRS